MKASAIPRPWPTALGGLAAMAVIALTLAMTACPFTTSPDRINPTPHYDGLTAGEIWEQYQRSDRAHDQYKDRWVRVKLKGVRGGIDAIAGNSLYLRTPGRLSELQFKFRYTEDMDQYDVGDDRHWVICLVEGTNLQRSRLSFTYCRDASDAPRIRRPTPTEPGGPINSTRGPVGNTGPGSGNTGPGPGSGNTGPSPVRTNE